MSYEGIDPGLAFEFRVHDWGGQNEHPEHGHDLGDQQVHEHAKCEVDFVSDDDFLLSRLRGIECVFDLIWSQLRHGDQQSRWDADHQQEHRPSAWGYRAGQFVADHAGYGF